jgi:hypothetical protein
VIPIEDDARLVPGDGHGHALGHASVGSNASRVSPREVRDGPGRREAFLAEPRIKTGRSVARAECQGRAFAIVNIHFLSCRVVKEREIGPPSAGHIACLRETTAGARLHGLSPFICALVATGLTPSPRAFIRIPPPERQSPVLRGQGPLRPRPHCPSPEYPRYPLPLAIAIPSLVAVVAGPNRPRR